jgi:hypothetical protein
MAATNLSKENEIRLLGAGLSDDPPGDAMTLPALWEEIGTRAFVELEREEADPLGMIKSRAVRARYKAESLTKAAA